MQNKCVASNKFVEAELCKTRIEQFKKKEKQKLLEELRNHHERQREQLDIEKKEELDKFNSEWDDKYFRLRDEYEQKEAGMQENQKKELEDKQLEIEAEINNLVPKPSSEAINLNCILENLKKLKE